jgi:hypothetical protein
MERFLFAQARRAVPLAFFAAGKEETNAPLGER